MLAGRHRPEDLPMEYLKFLQRESGIFSTRFAFVVLCASIGEGIVIATIISATSGEAVGRSEAQSLLLFLIGLLIFSLARGYIINRTCESVETVIQKVRTRICDRVRQAELGSFQAIGKTTIQQTLARDCQALNDAARTIMHAISGLGVMLSALIYIALLSSNLFVWMTAMLAAVFAFFARQQKTAQREYDKVSAEEQSFFDVLSEELDGFKELRISQEKSQDLLENDIMTIVGRVKQTKLAITRKLNLSLVAGWTFFYLLLGTIVFVLPTFIERGSIPVAKVSTTFMFVFSPMYDLASGIVVFVAANAAVNRLTALQSKLAELTRDAVTTRGRAARMQSLRCEQLMFAYPRQPERREAPFVVGPLDFEIRRGEIVFIIGGNGSGKSTFLHLLCGLYWPSSGTLFVNSEEIPHRMLTRYRSYFSLILQDFHLFKRLLGHPHIDRERINYLLDRLQLRGITDIDSEGRVTNLSLSTGQKKRLALLAVECDDREVIILDEWAADQDPEFRRFFYEVYLPELRARGKAVVAATHDDRYFHLADRVLRMDQGQLSLVAHTAPSPLAGA